MGNAASTQSGAAQLAASSQSSSQSSSVVAVELRHIAPASGPSFSSAVPPFVLHHAPQGAHAAKVRATQAPCACAHLHPHKTCLSYLVSSFGRSFYLAYGIRAGISLALHVIKLLRSKQPLKVFDLSELVGAHGLPIDAVRVGLFLGGFTGIYNGVRCLLARWLGMDNRWTVMSAGALGGLSLLSLPADTHRTLALYMLARVGQCWYNQAKFEGRWHLWGSDWAHGDSLLFSLCSAQVMYAYVMRPETLPKAYFDFIVRTGPIPLGVLDNVKSMNRGQGVDLNVLQGVVARLAPKGAPLVSDTLAKLTLAAYGPGAPPAFPPLLPCTLLHPQHAHCSHQWADTFFSVAKRTIPLYLSLTFVPMVVLRFWAVVKHPLESVTRGLWSATRSTGFLSTFVTAYMFLICMHRRVATRDHRAVYALAGFVSAWSILIEQKSRRSELALYVLPRAVDSLFQAMQSREWLASVPHGEKALFCGAMALLMVAREEFPHSMSPLLRRLLNFFVPTYKSLPMDHPAADAAVAATLTSNSADNGLLLRATSDGLSSSSVNGVIPLPSPGVSFSREQSFAVPTHASHLPPSSSYALFARDVSPTASPPAPVDPSASASPEAYAAAALSQADHSYPPPLHHEPFVAARVDVIEQRESAAAPSQRQATASRHANSSDGDSDSESRADSQYPKKDPDAPKRGVTAWILFSNAKRDEVKEANPYMKFGDVAKAISEMWRAASAEEKATYEEAAAADKLRYEREMSEYKRPVVAATDGSKNSKKKPRARGNK